MIEVDQYQRIRYLRTAQGFSQRAIARELGISRNTVRKYCEGDELPIPKPRERVKPIITDDVKDWIQGYLKEDEEANKVLGATKQRHTAWRIHERLCLEHGFSGSYEAVARAVRELRPKEREVFIPLAWDPGDAVQVDWGQAKVYLAGEPIKAHLFCARLCYSALPFVVAYPAERNEFLLDGHRQAFEFFQGVPRRVIYDNLRTVVKEGWGRCVTQKQPQFRLFEAHYAFISEFCNPRQGHEKGLVEGLVGWFRRNILVPIPHAENWNELNAIMLQQCLNSLQRILGGYTESIGAAYERERCRLLPLPTKPLETCRLQTSRVRPDSLVRVDNNYYSVPAFWVGQWLTVKAYPFRVEIWAHGEQVAQHERYFSKGHTIYDLGHYIDVLERKPRAVRQAKPIRETVTAEVQAVRDHLPEGVAGDKEFVQILRLLLEYGEVSLLAAINVCQMSGAISYETIRFHLLQQLQTVSEPALVSIERSACGPSVTPTDLNVYDDLVKAGVQ